MNQSLTLLIPTHNRHVYLDRILDYYKDSEYALIIADSTAEAYRGITEANPLIKYLHMPGIGLPGKIDLALQGIQTPYVAMCADDDFLIPDGIVACVGFLEQHRDVAAAQGNMLSYRRGSRIGELDFRILYNEPLPRGMEADEPFERLESLFSPYKSFFYAVHRTGYLQKTFRHAGEIVGNLYMNEYLAAIVPLMQGKYVELAVFYQVREYSEHSDDKTTINLDKLFYQKQYEAEMATYLGFLAGKVSAVTGCEKTDAFTKTERALKRFAKELRAPVPPPTLKKRIGTVIARVPLLGNRLIENSRRRERMADLTRVVSTARDRKNLHVVETIIKKHLHAIW